MRVPRDFDLRSFVFGQIGADAMHRSAPAKSDHRAVAPFPRQPVGPAAGALRRAVAEIARLRAENAKLRSMLTARRAQAIGGPKRRATVVEKVVVGKSRPTVVSPSVERVIEGEAAEVQDDGKVIPLRAVASVEDDSGSDVAAIEGDPWVDSDDDPFSA